MIFIELFLAGAGGGVGMGTMGFEYCAFMGKHLKYFIYIYFLFFYFFNNNKNIFVVKNKKNKKTNPMMRITLVIPCNILSGKKYLVCEEEWGQFLYIFSILLFAGTLSNFTGNVGKLGLSFVSASILLKLNLCGFKEYV